MTARSWIHNLFARTPRPVRKAAVHSRLRVETLEDRLAPAVSLSISNPLPLPEGDSGTSSMVFVVTRSGDLDPAVVPHLQKRLGKSSEDIIALLNHDAGVSGLSGGNTDLGKLAADPDPRSQFAIDLYCYRARKYIGAYLAVLGGCDGIVFGGGVGEHVPAVRQRILTGLGWAGIELDTAANDAARGQEARIDSAKLPVRVQVIPVEEEGVLVRAAVEILAG